MKSEHCEHEGNCMKTRCSLSTPETANVKMNNQHEIGSLKIKMKRKVNMRAKASISLSNIAASYDYMIASIKEGALLAVIATVWSTQAREMT